MYIKSNILVISIQYCYFNFYAIIIHNTRSVLRELTPSYPRSPLPELQEDFYIILTHKMTNCTTMP